MSPCNVHSFDCLQHNCRASLYLILQMEGDYDTELCLGREAGHGRCTSSRATSANAGKPIRLKAIFFHSIVPFQFSWGLRDHIESEHEERDFSCPNCNKVFASAGNLSKHLGQRVCLDRLPATSLETVEVEVTQVIICFKVFFSQSHVHLDARSLCSKGGKPRMDLKVKTIPALIVARSS